MKYDLILLYSGGYDSTLLLHLAKYLGFEPFCVLFDYEQHHVRELEYARKTCIEMNVPYQVLKINLDVPSKLTFGNIQYRGVSEWYVPSRNLTFLSITAGIAESMGINQIWYGANYDDRENQFPDCYQEWVYTLNQLLKINGSTQIKIEAPLLGMNKKLIENLGKMMFQLTKKEVFSGYEKE